ncbi:VOC family protein [Antrihabitans cavernicola]|uniref:Glyoxalase n=1 Tax=Antrihabitans cavernicola TaxID=2495913 RepID=A0A5A7S8R6_9NOCA|nr:VOC family protein [Spelaeibacter cavernicola]KAA0022530.1 glyoxalase [Spelaeibacter cavernicola]
MTEKTVVQTVIWPTLRYDDARAAIRFLVAMGFEEVVVYGEGEIVDHAQLRWPGGGGVMLGSAQREDSAIKDVVAGTGSIYVVIDNPDELHDRAVGLGANITRGLTDEDYGSRGFTMKDPEGVYWSFGTYGGE